MSKATSFLDEVREYEIDKYDIANELSDELHRIIDEEFNGNFSTFMQNEVLNPFLLFLLYQKEIKENLLRILSFLLFGPYWLLQHIHFICTVSIHIRVYRLLLEPR